MSRYLFEGNLRAHICRECWDHIAHTEVLIYRHREDQDVAELVAASAKRNFALLSDDQVEAKTKYLLARGRTDSDGEFRIEIDNDAYAGKALEVDVRITEPGGKDRSDRRPPLQATLASLQPDWKDNHTRWEHYVSARHWCHILAMFDVWVICGRVVATGSSAGLQGMTVRAYDRDWLQDDLLGQDTTNNAGLFRIYYTSATFKRTPFSPTINIEMVSGPDLYFEVEDSNGNLVIDEKPAKGRVPPRENVGHCYCETLEVGESPPYSDPLFTHIGNFHVVTDIDTTTGKTLGAKDGAGGVGWGFFGHIKLRGFCPKVHPINGKAMFYRFRYVDPVTSAVTTVTADMLRSVLVGSKLVWWDADSDGVFGWTTQSIRVAASGATAPVSGGTGAVPDHVLVPDANGWIAVDPDAVDDGFNGALIRLKTNKIVTGGNAPGSGAGVTPADPKVGARVELIYETTTADASGDPDPAAIYTQPITASVLVNNWTEVRELNLDEFLTGTAGGCTGLTATVTIKYTVNHELVDGWSLTMTSAATASGWTAPSLPAGTASVAATHPAITVSLWPPCSYTVRLTSRRALTDGENNDDWDTTLLTFCKS